MADLEVPINNRIPKEALLLGKINNVLRGCGGGEAEGHGLTANDLVVVKDDGTVVPLIVYIAQGGVGGDIGDTTITRTDGTTITLREIADNVIPLNAISDTEAESDFDSI